MISGQRPRPLDHEAGHNNAILVNNFTHTVLLASDPFYPSCKIMQQ